MAEKAKWYVVNTFSGYENKVKATLEKSIDNRNLHNYFYDIQIPMSEEVEEKDGKQKVALKKLLPGYVFIKMIMTDDTWYIVRNTRGVSGFVGPAGKPVSLTNEEIDRMGINDTPATVDMEVGETVLITSGALKGFNAQITEVNIEKQKIKGLVDMFGRETPAELDFAQVEKLD
ncbi:transcription termination/antitermination protein NusG [Clostridium cellulovorans]|uniref:Transcription termination/antitermination protein NusG n=1 Tax=Clostridium cellulovorans (strain ATCC 35296 / DSM 3052 / OCM 3 / 743B) TaxID=573061 RepID=D9SXB3_CLOC7|nr:transcription termination/antitermination protein NusG [Clostridium cellulovorans]ADL53416.1 NusG antitermination factor [Clostridium cellulovorans 743B]